MQTNLIENPNKKETHLFQIQPVLLVFYPWVKDQKAGAHSQKPHPARSALILFFYCLFLKRWAGNQIPEVP